MPLPFTADPTGLGPVTTGKRWDLFSGSLWNVQELLTHNKKTAGELKTLFTFVCKAPIHNKSQQNQNLLPGTVKNENKIKNILHFMVFGAENAKWNKELDK